MTTRRQTEDVLLIEDQALITLYVEELIQAAGYDRITCVSTLAQATRWLAANRPLFVVMEMHVRDGTTDTLLGPLADRDIPFLIHTTHEYELAAELLGDTKVPRWQWLSKPCAPDEFEAAIRKLQTLVS